jgi:radical SAM superfamily enzyme YgiQ (UPF0313 family)
MNDLVLVALNAKYIHTNLAVRSLKAQISDAKVSIIEMSINDPLHQIVHHILRSQGNIIGFSCYIWNMELILKVSQMIKQANPDVKILMGGPEVSFDGKELLTQYPWLDYIIAGEGEESVKLLLKANNDKNTLLQIPGLSFRTEKNEIFEGALEQAMVLDTLEFPYSKEGIMTIKDKIIYYETMRGCPFKCSYCLSSIGKGVRTFSLERVYKEIDFFIDLEIKQVKLVDRTFNFDIKRAKAIFKYIIKRGGNTNFHFEMTGDLLDTEMIELLKEAKPGLIQFEIGVQSTDNKTLEAIHRKSNLDLLRENVTKILDYKNIHVHLDLIAGLPFESYDVFKKSFNETIIIKPDMLQLGFLKCLKGTQIRKENAIHDYQFMEFPPYEVISNAYISSLELYRLRNIEVLVDRYYNCDGFSYSLTEIFTNGIFLSPFDFFEKFSDYWLEQGYYDLGKSKIQLYEILNTFLRKTTGNNNFEAVLKFDFLMMGHKHISNIFTDRSPDKEWIFEFLKNSENIDRYLPEFRQIAPKKIYTQLKFQSFILDELSFLGDEKLGTNHTKCLVIFYEHTFIRINEEI